MVTRCRFGGAVPVTAISLREQDGIARAYRAHARGAIGRLRDHLDIAGRHGLVLRAGGYRVLARDGAEQQGIAGEAATGRFRPYPMRPGQQSCTWRWPLIAVRPP